MIGVLGFNSWWGLGIFFTTMSRTALEPTQPSIQWVPGAFSLGIKLITHLHLVFGSKNEWRYTSTPQYTFMAWCSVKAQGKLHLYLLYLQQGLRELSTTNSRFSLICFNTRRTPDFRTFCLTTDISCEALWPAISICTPSHLQ
jgi:hypothetical protein